MQDYNTKVPPKSLHIEEEYPRKSETLFSLLSDTNDKLDHLRKLIELTRSINDSLAARVENEAQKRAVTATDGAGLIYDFSRFNENFHYLLNNLDAELSTLKQLI